LHASLPDWLPYPAKVEGLHALARRYRLAVISNTDDELFARTGKRLECASTGS
jgi:2-haloacid dehalogenase